MLIPLFEAFILNDTQINNAKYEYIPTTNKRNLKEECRK